MRFFIFGAGYSACAFARQSNADFYGTTRSENRFSDLEKANIKPLIFPNYNSQTNLENTLNQITHLIISIPPDETGDSLLRQSSLLDHTKKLEWIGYLSTIGVYGDHQGKWIDETAPCYPKLERNKARLQAENEWTEFAKLKNIPLAILRLGGIYGPGRNAFIKLTENKARRIIKKDQVFNRIHSDDIAGILNLFSQNKVRGIYNLVDCEPAPPQDVITYASTLMGMIPPIEQSFEEATMSSMARSFYNDNKRISNRKLRSIGYLFKYQNYQLALDAMWASGNWK
ncbi:SDR family oxidoreductase [Bartonella tamiae]|uniref:NAD-dependent epimerase/dehydratase domain-containing protein n=1 Tax=Bartonella tamiae Th239 TaxID=1094558 RepID=J0R405_9HYPH|nr:SDR family oxidoreductase [Bartonella tamiae]EJF90374.1 hypothetical protein ME5_00775 [Bartonella tamiae Th239]EJF93682.1 hypothetical protein MEG_01106 [Bartonella tamiae Th307]